MGLWNSLAGSLRIRITSASVGDILSAINDAGIDLRSIVWVDDLTVDATILRLHYKPLKKMLSRKGAKLELTDRFGLYWAIQSLKRRPVLLLGIALYLALAIFLPTRIFFVTVAGNDSVSTETVITQAENVGIRFGASRSAVRSERVKNALLAAVPQLQWAGVNTYGCVAVISVRERNIVPESNSPSGVCSIVAKCDGVIQNVTVTRGNVLCKTGQAVKAGQVLVSGYTDCGISIKVTGAEGEIYGQTIHHLDALSPTIRAYRREQIGQNINYSLIIGKKRINLYKGSGISEASCVKMYQDHYLTLPGGFQLPIALTTETQIYHTKEVAQVSEQTVISELSGQAERYMLDSMLAGTIIAEQVFTQVEDEAIHLRGEYGCLEMIGQIYNEEIIKENG